MTSTNPRTLKRTILLHSSENFVWHSMQEIVPMIVGTWLGAQRPGAHEVRCVDVDRARLPEYLPWLLKADNVVFACFTLKLCRLARLLRQELRLDSRYLLYLHNQATIACWPYHVWGLGEFLRTDDVFLSSCELDAATLPLSFENARVELIPFTLPNAEDLAHARPIAEGPLPFVYVGRISAQKNLHLLLHAFALFLGGNPGYSGQLLLYGGEDGLGSPNMGLRQEGYLDFLRRLCEQLGIRERVRFLGHRSREELAREISARKHIFVSPSLHSDENFGMAAFRSLCLGQKAALSRWGGHADLAKHFADRVFLAEVQGTSSGPWVSPDRFAQAMDAAMRSSLAEEPRGPGPALPHWYHPTRISKDLLKIATEDPPFPGDPLSPSVTARRIVSRRQEFARSEPDSCRIFSSYEDPAATPFFRGYGMRPAHEVPCTRRAIRLVPWARIKSDGIHVEDPHRGAFLVPSDAPGAFRVLDFHGAKAQISEKQANSLLNEGWGFPEEARQ